MPTPDINFVKNLNCSRLAFLYGATSAVDVKYLNCGDYTPITLTSTDPGVPGTVFTTVTGVSASVIITTGTLSAGPQIGGFTQTYQRYGVYNISATAA
jgi:hypothetical protein